MKPVIIKWLILTCAIMTAAFLIDGIHVTGFFSALFAAAVLSFLNVFLRPVLILLTLPINILSFGLFTFIVNALMLKMASGVIPGFLVEGFWSAVFGSIIISLVNAVINSFTVTKGGSIEYIDLKHKGGNRWE